MRRTIRARITLTAVSVIGTAAVAAAVVLVVLLHESLLRGVDARATIRAQDVGALAARGQLPATLAGTDEDGTVAQLVVKDHVVAQSPVVRGAVPLASFAPRAGRASGRITIRTVHNTPIRGGAAYRVAATRVVTPQGPGVVYVAASIEPVNDSIHALLILLLIVVPALVLLVGATTWWLVGRTLDPVEAMRRQVAEISATELGRRVVEPDTNDEIHRLAKTMNAMLERLEGAVVLQRSFVSDAAHELRSPLAAMRTELEVAAAHPDAEGVPAVVERLAATSRRMERLVEDLLVLATAEEQGVRRRADVDLDEVVLEQLQSLRTTTHLRLDVGALGAARVLGDRDQLERVVANLLDNAERHARTTIAVELHITDGHAELIVADDGLGIPRADRAHVFDRFSRVDTARDRQSGGAGLGLAIARRIIDGHGGSIGIADTDVGTRMVVCIPVQATDSQG